MLQKSDIFAISWQSCLTKVDSDMSWWKLKTNDCPHARKTLQGHDGRFRRGRVWAPPPAVLAVRPNLSLRPVCLRCASYVLVNDFHLFLNWFQEKTFARVFPSCTRFPCGVKREKCNLGEEKKVCVEKATNPTIFVLHGQKHTGPILFLLCLGFKKTLNLSLFGPATTGILA